MTQKEITQAIVKLGANKLFEFKRYKNGRATYEADRGKIVCSVTTEGNELERFEKLEDLTKCEGFAINY